MAEPTDYADWATDNLVNGDQNTPNKIRPSNPKIASGYGYPEQAAREELNWWMNSVGQNVRFLRGAVLPVQKPINLTPVNGTTVTTITPTLVGSTFKSTYALAHKNSSFRMSLSPDMFPIVYQSGVIGPLETHTVNLDLEISTVYYWDVAYSDAEDVWSEFSDATSLTTADLSVATPSVTSPLQGAVGIQMALQVTGSAFAVLAGADTHLSSQWEVATDSLFSNVIDDSGEDFTNLVSYTASGLSLVSTVYYARVRYKGTLFGWSDYSTTVSFTTASEFTFNEDTSLTGVNEGWQACVSDDGVEFGSSYVTSSGFATPIPFGLYTKTGATWAFDRDSISDEPVNNSKSWGPSKLLRGIGKGLSGMRWNTQDGAANIGDRWFDVLSLDVSNDWSVINTQRVTGPASNAKPAQSPGNISGDGNFLITVAAGGPQNSILSFWSIANFGQGTSVPDQKESSSGSPGNTRYWGVPMLNHLGDTAILPYQINPGSGIEWSYLVYTRVGIVWSLEWQSPLAQVNVVSNNAVSGNTGQVLFGACDISSDGNTIVMTNLFSGENATIYTRTGTTWTKLQALSFTDYTGAPVADLRSGVAISRDASKIIMTRAYSGSSKGPVGGLFTKIGSSYPQLAWLEPTAALEGTTSFGGGNLSISDDASVVAVMGTLVDNDASNSQAYIFSGV